MPQDPLEVPELLVLMDSLVPSVFQGRAEHREQLERREYREIMVLQVFRERQDQMDPQECREAQDQLVQQEPWELQGQQASQEPQVLVAPQAIQGYLVPQDLQVALGLQDQLVLLEQLECLVLEGPSVPKDHQEQKVL